MRLLIVAATEPEIAPLLEELSFYAEKNPRLKSYEINGRTVDVLITGIGMTATAAWVSRTLAIESYSAALNVGLCGSFDRTIALGEVVGVVEDCIAYVGAEDDKKFLSLSDLNLQSDDEFPYVGGKLISSGGSDFTTLGSLKNCRGITVNLVHGNKASINAITKRLHPQVESMEGAGFYYACAIAGVPALQVRSVSNYVERRNRDAWQIGLAVKNLNNAILEFLNS